MGVLKESSEGKTPCHAVRWKLGDGEFRISGKLYENEKNRKTVGQGGRTRHEE